MFANSSILPVRSDGVKTRFEIFMQYYANRFSFGRIKSVHTSIYVGIFFILVAIFVLWKLCVLRFVKILNRIFATVKSQYLDN